jgi:hypothetical protein
MDLSYLIDKVRSAPFSEAPFRHVYIRDFFSDEHFAEITSAAEVDISDVPSDERLFEELFARSYKIIGFPGCITDKDEYIRWHKSKEVSHKTNTSCEGFGVTLRLTKPKSPALTAINDFIHSAEFQAALVERFEIDPADVFYDAGLQKYLDGYEISPHPDIRKKALTYMVNIIPGKDAEQLECHTHYLKFRDEFDYIRHYWAGNADKDRCWVPWSWCDTQQIQRENNSIVIFSPSNDTLHAVKTDYDHLRRQRTQLYGNFWYHVNTTTAHPQWGDLVISGASEVKPPLTDRVVSKVKRTLTTVMRRKEDDYVIADRLQDKTRDAAR